MERMKGWRLIDFNDLSVGLGLFYAKMFENRIHCALAVIFFV